MVAAAVARIRCCFKIDQNSTYDIFARPARLALRGSSRRAAKLVSFHQLVHHTPDVRLFFRQPLFLGRLVGAAQQLASFDAIVVDPFLGYPAETRPSGLAVEGHTPDYVFAVDTFDE